MRWSDRFMRGFGRFAIPNITGYIIAFQVMCMLLIWERPAFAGDLLFNARLVMQGEWWRAITFLFMPVSTSALFAAFVLYLYWLMGTALEAHWGTARYNLFLLVGAVMTMATAFVGAALGLGGVGTNVYLMESVFLAFAALYPDFVIYLFFILPIRVKWLALATWVLLGLQFLVSDWIGRVMLVAAVANFLLFFWRDIVHRIRHGRRQMGRQVKRIQRSGPVAPQAMHRCVVCGATEKSHPEYEFRYCGECGGKCYCLEHLREHVHARG